MLFTVASSNRIQMTLHLQSYDGLRLQHFRLLSGNPSWGRMLGGHTFVSPPGGTACLRLAVAIAVWYTPSANPGPCTSASAAALGEYCGVQLQIRESM